MDTVYVYDPIYLEHDLPSHPENARRLRRILGTLEDEGMLARLRLLEPRPATAEELQRVHTPEHIERVRRVAQAGGGVHGHPGGTTGGAISLKAAVDGLVEGKSAPEKAKEVPELQTALDKWGYVDPGEVKDVIDMVDTNKDMWKNLLFNMGYGAFDVINRLG